MTGQELLEGLDDRSARVGRDGHDVLAEAAEDLQRPRERRLLDDDRAPRWAPHLSGERDGLLGPGGDHDPIGLGGKSASFEVVGECVAEVGEPGGVIPRSRHAVRQPVRWEAAPDVECRWRHPSLGERHVDHVGRDRAEVAEHEVRAA